MKGASTLTVEKVVQVTFIQIEDEREEERERARRPRAHHRTHLTRGLSGSVQHSIELVSCHSSVCDTPVTQRLTYYAADFVSVLAPSLLALATAAGVHVFHPAGLVVGDLGFAPAPAEGRGGYGAKRADLLPP